MQQRDEEKQQIYANRSWSENGGGRAKEIAVTIGKKKMGTRIIKKK